VTTAPGNKDPSRRWWIIEMKRATPTYYIAILFLASCATQNDTSLNCGIARKLVPTPMQPWLCEAVLWIGGITPNDLVTITYNSEWDTLSIIKRTVIDDGHVIAIRWHGGINNSNELVLDNGDPLYFVSSKFASKALRRLIDSDLLTRDGGNEGGGYATNSRLHIRGGDYRGASGYAQSTTMFDIQLMIDESEDQNIEFSQYGIYPKRNGAFNLYIELFDSIASQHSSK
jgi:hypothetical protein